ncbi:MAG: DUF5522 domain-containing protein [Proteobacteria bacterium]|nr:DUF5522 domain-containing protein [Pseudomonadota bacterium]
MKPSETDNQSKSEDDKALVLGLDYYLDPITNFMVFTEAYHLRRAYCCGNSCRHCPYDSDPA